MAAEKYTIDFSDIKHYSEVHLTIAEALDFPEWYVCNWGCFG